MTDKILANIKSIKLSIKLYNIVKIVSFTKKLNM